MERAKRASLVWAVPATRDFDSIFEFLSRTGQRRALAFVRVIQSATERLEYDPEIGPLADDIEHGGTCRAVACPPHRIVYRHVGNVVFILRIWDSRRNPDDLTLPPDAEVARHRDADEEN